MHATLYVLYLVHQSPEVTVEGEKVCDVNSSIYIYALRCEDIARVHYIYALRWERVKEWSRTPSAPLSSMSDRGN